MEKSYYNTIYEHYKQCEIIVNEAVNEKNLVIDELGNIKDKISNNQILLLE